MPAIESRAIKLLAVYPAGYSPFFLHVESGPKIDGQYWMKIPNCVSTQLPVGTYCTLSGKGFTIATSHPLDVTESALVPRLVIVDLKPIPAYDRDKNGISD